VALSIDLSGRTALVTGAGRGIGRAVAESLAAAGARVALAARSEAELRETAEATGGAAWVFPVDLGSAGAATDLALRVRAAMGDVDILVNNAGISYSRRSERADQATIASVLQVNLASALELTLALAPSMFGRGGAVVNISSAAAVAGMPAQALYAASKGGLDAATRALACEWGPRGVRVNSVAPGLVITRMWEKGRERPGVAETLERHVALRRWGAPPDVAGVVTFLVSDLAAYVTGETIVVDGGMARMFDVL
jgi:NAD(P)-dependent dehydrogenase (short-subunit alcohol dehydrogenase family)